MIPLDTNGLARLTSTWLDPQVTLSALVDRFRLNSRDREALRLRLGPKPTTRRITIRSNNAAIRAKALRLSRRANDCSDLT